MAWVEVSNPAGTRLGRINITSWESSDALDQAGRFSFDAPADTKVGLLVHKNTVDCYAVVNGSVLNIGSGIIDSVTWALGANGAAIRVSGGNYLSDLANRTLGGLVIDNGAGGATYDGPQLLIAKAKSGWSLDTVDGHDTTLSAVNYTFAGETVLAGFLKLVELTGEHFRAGSGKSLVWLQSDQPDSGLRAFYNIEPAGYERNTNAIILSDIEMLAESYECYVGRVYAIGAGTGASQTKLTLPLPFPIPGWTTGIDAKGYYLQHTATWSTYGNDMVVTFKDISDPNLLLQAAIIWMLRHLEPVVSYRCTLAGVRQTLRPGTKITVDAHKYIDGQPIIDIRNTSLLIMEARNRFDAQGLRTVEIVCSTSDRLPETNDSKLVSNAKTVQALGLHSQPNS